MDLIYRQHGYMICSWCAGKGSFFNEVTLQLGDTAAIGRYVRKCTVCHEMTIGERVSDDLLKWFKKNYINEFLDDRGVPLM